MVLYTSMGLVTKVTESLMDYIVQCSNVAGKMVQWQHTSRSDLAHQ